MKQKALLAGIDVGSTTVKIAVLRPEDRKILHTRYLRHGAEQTKTIKNILKEAHALFPGVPFLTTFCGSAGQAYAETTGGAFIQEVVANVLAIRAFYPEARTAIELGGQDAKVIFLERDEERGQLSAADMRMNGSCAGGTGAFIDQIAELLDIKVEEFNAHAERGRRVHEIAGRCGVFAKTDIAPLLNQGVDKEDLALSTFHALARQTIGGLAQGRIFRPKLIMEGGPLTFNSRLVEVFKERLGLGDEDLIIPERPEILVACGAAIAPLSMPFSSTYDADKAFRALDGMMAGLPHAEGRTDAVFFGSPEEREDFQRRHSPPKEEESPPQAGRHYRLWLGVDAGSTTCKFVLINDDEEIVHRFYAHNRGEPLDVLRDGLEALHRRYTEAGARLSITGLGTTGYGEKLVAAAFKADYNCVETVAHARAARKFVPDVSFIMDIGGQDMKAISLSNEIISGIVLNEACSAGCGSFLETYARSLNIPADRIADLAFEAKHPAKLGSRCTVFMNSTIVTEQKNGLGGADIIAGICRSIIENVFTKVVRISNFDHLGEKVMVQGGTFKNDAVLRAFEQYTGRTVIRAPYPGEMGALGVALLTKEQALKTGKTGRFIGFEALKSFSYSKNPGLICPFCTNHCARTVLSFNDGSFHVTGNRCEKGEVLGDPKDGDVRERLQVIRRNRSRVGDMLIRQKDLLFTHYPVKAVCKSRSLCIGLPRSLSFWSDAPFWSALLRSLGFDVVFSDDSSYRLFDDALPFVPSDTACFPAKLAHGHVESLLRKKVDRIFIPQMIRMPQKNNSADGSFYCAMLQGYPLILDKNNETEERCGVPLDHPTFHWFNETLRRRQIVEFLKETYGVKPADARIAYKQAVAVEIGYGRRLREEGERLLQEVDERGDFAVLVACRPYQIDPLVNHGLSEHFTRLGVPVLTLESLPSRDDVDLSVSRTETVITFINHILEAALRVAEDRRLELVQIVSFGCGHDAVLSDEMTRLLGDASGKNPLILKLDEGDAAGPLHIRVNSFVETVRERRAAEGRRVPKLPRKDEVYSVKFTKADKDERTIYLPNLNKSFSRHMAGVFESTGFRAEPLPLADDKAIELGKKFVHNDICFPAQINVGEFLAALSEKKIDPKTSALGLAKNCESCRARQYPALARKALDDAGYPDIPIITTGKDDKNMHPGFRLGIRGQLRFIWGITIIDALERMRRRLRPYERHEGETERVFEDSLHNVCRAIQKNLLLALKALARSVRNFNTVATSSGPRKPRVGVVGEILLNYHPKANAFIEDYLEKHGMEVVIPNIYDFFRKIPYITREMGRRRKSPRAFLDFLSGDLIGRIFDFVNAEVTKRMRNFRYKDTQSDVRQMADNVKDFFDITYRTGEGWKLPAEIIEMEKEGVHSFVIVQPFGCMPNHITGRGLIKLLKKKLPHLQILSLDYDPDVSRANIENRLQMLIINARERARKAV